MEVVPTVVGKFLDRKQFEHLRLALALSTIRGKFSILNLFFEFWKNRQVQPPYDAAHIQYFVFELLVQEYSAPLNAFWILSDLLSSPPLDVSTGRAYKWLNPGYLKPFRRTEALLRLATTKRTPHKAPIAYLDKEMEEKWETLPFHIRSYIGIWLGWGVREDTYKEITDKDIAWGERSTARGQLTVVKDKVWKLQGRNIPINCNCADMGGGKVETRFCVFHSNNGNTPLPSFPAPIDQIRKAFQILGWTGQTPRRTYATALRRSAQQGRHWTIEALSTPGWLTWATYVGYTIDDNREKQIVPALGGWRNCCTDKASKTSSHDAYWPDTHDQSLRLDDQLCNDRYLKEDMTEEEMRSSLTVVTKAEADELGVNKPKKTRGPRKWKKSKLQMLVAGSNAPIGTAGGKKAGGVKKTGGS